MTEVVAAPSARAGPATFREFIDGRSCDECGFEIDDRRTLGRGTLVISRAGDQLEGLAAAFAGFGTDGVRVDLSADGETVTAECVDRAGNGFASALASHERGVQLQVAYDETGVKGNLAGRADQGLGFAVGVRVRMLEIPLDLAPLGLHVAPYAVAYSGWPSPESETTTGLCAIHP